MGKSYTELFELINLLPNIREGKCLAMKFSTEDIVVISYIHNDSAESIREKILSCDMCK